jgi:hypothetical protein
MMLIARAMLRGLRQGRISRSASGVLPRDLSGRFAAGKAAADHIDWSQGPGL